MNKIINNFHLALSYIKNTINKHLLIIYKSTTLNKLLFKNKYLIIALAIITFLFYKILNSFPLWGEGFTIDNLNNINLFNIKSIIFIVGFSFGMVLDMLIKSNYLGYWVLEKYLYFCRFSYFTMYILFFIISLFIFIILSYFHVGFLSEMEVYINIIDGQYYTGEGEAGGIDNLSNKNNKSSGEIANSIDPKIGVVNVDNNFSAPNGTVQLAVEIAIFKVPVEGINNIVAAGSSAGGAALGVKTAQLVGGSPMIKAAAGLGVMAAVQTTTFVMSKALNSNSNSNKNPKDPNVNNFIGDLLNNSDSKLLADKYTEFPLNLLTDMNTLVNLEILVLILLIYVFIGQLITNVEFEKYLPNNRLGKLLLLLLNRYKIVWSTSKNLVLVSCIIISIICVFTLKLGFYFILNS